MNQKKIFIASVLKPVDDIRHYKKLALSLAKANKYQIFILGKGYPKKTLCRQIQFESFGDFNRSNILKRIIAQFIFSRRIHHDRPQVVIITTVELLPISVILKFIFKFKLIYDIQENYTYNVLYQKEYPLWIKLILLPLTKLAVIFHHWVDHFFLAESSYIKELKLRTSSVTILENKAIKNPASVAREKWNLGDNLKLLFTGTLSDYSGVKNAIDVYFKIRSTYKNTTLTIIGKCIDSNLLRHLKQTANLNSSIELFSDTRPVDHERIMENIINSNLGIIGYTPNKTNQNRIPTKLYEYAGYGLPYLIHHHEPWLKKSKELGGGIAIDLKNFNVDKVLRELSLLRPAPSESAIWREEEVLLLNAIDSLIKQN